jgi:hypothetical protein
MDRNAEILSCQWDPLDEESDTKWFQPIKSYTENIPRGEFEPNHNVLVV